ncbi:C-C motif chemokine 3-like [Tachysurus fulvidraco]|uniref:C-C motif chemokine 3-like n=1 Tax=Tachysurus fulvidraco TaxID=1234273 RepID=UPI001FEE18A7|nr:C-C motif chemokine 3-like [Tachysurus fulvidraco]
MISHSLLLVLTCLQSFTRAQNADGPDQCCTKFLTQPLPVSIITACKVTELQCAKPGVIFTLQDGRHVCADPSFKWVKHHMYRIDQRLIV